MVAWKLINSAFMTSPVGFITILALLSSRYTMTTSRGKNQLFSVAINGANYSIRTIWRDAAGWVIDLLDSSGAGIVTGLPLVTGAIRMTGKILQLLL